MAQRMIDLQQEWEVDLILTWAMEGIRRGNYLRENPSDEDIRAAFPFIRRLISDLFRRSAWISMQGGHAGLTQMAVMQAAQAMLSRRDPRDNGMPEDEILSQSSQSSQPSR